MKTTVTKKLVSLVCAVFLLLSLTGCSKYVSKYNAVGFVHSNESNSAFMTFISFNGSLAFKLHSTQEGDIKYFASLEEGNAIVYYDYNGVKTELFSIQSGEVLDSHGGYIEAGTVYIIVETDEKCTGGDFHFNLK